MYPFRLLNDKIRIHLNVLPPVSSQFGLALTNKCMSCGLLKVSYDIWYTKLDKLNKISFKINLSQPFDLLLLAYFFKERHQKLPRISVTSNQSKLPPSLKNLRKYGRKIAVLHQFENKYVSKDSTNCLWRVSVLCKMQNYFASASNKDLLHKNSTQLL